MAGIAKIASKDLDEVNKINSAVLIGLGTAAVGEVRTGETFYAGSTVLKTGTMPTKAIVAAAETYEEGYHAGNPGGLSAIDADLAAANIKLAEVIFGFVGTLAPGALAEDVLGDGVSGQTASHTGFYRAELLLNAGAELTISTTTDTYDASSRAVAVGHVHCSSTHDDKMKLRLYMGGVEVAETGLLPISPGVNFVLTATRALVGDQECKLVAKNYHSAGSYIRIPCMEAGTFAAAGIGIGSIKLV